MPKDSRVLKVLKHTPRGLVVVLVLATAAVLALGQYPHHELAGPNSTTVSRIIAAPAFVVALRIVVMYAVVFVLASILARIWNRQWLRKAGPFEVADDVQALKDERDRVRGEVQTAQARIGELNERLLQSNGVIERLGRALQEGPHRRGRPV